MKQQAVGTRFPVVGGGGKLAPGDTFYREEVQLASRNRGTLLEGLRYPITPTGMHYILIHFDIPEVDIKTWHLSVGGLVAKPLRYTLDELRRRPAVTTAVTMECAGNGRGLLAPRYIGLPWFLEAIGTAEWTGTPLRGVLEEAGVNGRAVEILFTGLDQGVQGGEIQYYQRSLSIGEAMRGEVLLAYAMNGAPLEPQHGYPLRLVVPGWYGMASIKWLDRIEAIGEPFQGYQQLRSYRYSQTAEDPGEPATTIRVRVLMVPPGIPDWLTRTRLVKPGPTTLIGRAWAGRSAIARVEVSLDGGATWSEAQLGDTVGPYAWTAWSFPWEARPGRYTLCPRATDTAGNVQPLSAAWNFLGVGNNMVQRVDVIVE